MLIMETITNLMIKYMSLNRGLARISFLIGGQNVGLLVDQSQTLMLTWQLN